MVRQAVWLLGWVVPLLAAPDTAAVVRVGPTVVQPAPRVPPIGVNGLGDIGAVSYAANNLIANSGNEPFRLRKLFRVAAAGPNWFEVDRGGTTQWDLWNSGLFSGAQVRVYRLADAAGADVPLQGDYLDLSNAAQAKLIRSDTVLPAGAPGCPQGGWLAQSWVTPHGISELRGTLRHTDVWSQENGRPVWYTVVALDANGNASAPCAEVSATPAANADAGPRIFVERNDHFNGLAPFQAGQAYGPWGGGWQPRVSGGTAPFRWTLSAGGQPWNPPAGVRFEPASGRLSGTPQTSPASGTVRLTVTDAAGRSDFRDLLLNPPAPPQDAQDKTAPQPPAGLQAVANNGSVTLTWQPSPSADVVGYRVQRSEVPGAQQQQRVILQGPGPELRVHDYVFLDRACRDFDMRWVNPRVRTIANNGQPGWWWQRRGAPVQFALVAHPQPLPTELRLPGETCLRATIGDGEAAIYQVPFTGVKGQDDHWYGQLEPGCSYRFEGWLRQDGLGRGGQVAFSFGHPAYQALRQAFTVSGAWARYTCDFTAPAERPQGGAVFGPTLTVQGPGTLWLDNLRLFRADTVAEREQRLVPNATIVQSLLACQPTSGPKGHLRLFGPLFNQSSLQALLSGHGETQVNISWYTGFEATSDLSLPVALETAFRTGDRPATRMKPWLTLQVYFTEAEWPGLLEYLAAPWDPARDTPAGKPYAWLRVQQRGHPRPWLDDFAEVVLEYGNETWHNGAAGYGFEGFGRFSHVWQGGREYGCFAQRFLGQALTGSPDWPASKGKLKLSLGGGYEAQWDAGDGRNWYAELAHTVCEPAAHLGYATYVGPKWETGDKSPATFDDHGVQETLVAYLTGCQPAFAKKAQARETLAARGVQYELTAYEGGPSGFYVPGQAGPELVAVAERYGKSQAMAVAALDTFLSAGAYGWVAQNYFVFGQGREWHSHTTMANGFRPSPGWLAMTLRNREARGDLVTATVESGPSYRRGDRELPLVGAYAFRDGDRWAVFLLSRKLDGQHDGTDFGDGFTPLTVHLPFRAARSVVLHQLAANPRANNLQREDVTLRSQAVPPSALGADGSLRLGPASGAPAGGLPPGAIYLYVFEGAR
ncbi:MAG: putative Ig domain-containing protein [Fimbriimonadaceae bacterium]|nr:putative Ig domain-containing protein [Fimbriimonadaceae bacterium]